MKTYYCPNCDEEKTLGEYQMFWTCEECEHDLELDPDGETYMEDGQIRYKDKTRVMDVTGRHERQLNEITRRIAEKLL